MKVIVIEDEKPAARRLKRMAEDLGLDVLAMLHSVEESMEWLQSNEHPELIFLDIQLSDGLSFEIFENVEVKSAIIFTTAYDEYALKAFKLKSIDYILKPIDNDDLSIAIDKYKDLSQKPNESLQFDLNQIKQMLVNPLDRQFKKRFTIRIGQHLKMINTSEIVCFYSQDKGTYLQTNQGRSYLLDFSLEQLENILDNEIFFRVNRKCYINLDYIDDIIIYSNSRLKIAIKSFDVFEIIVSREKVRDFKKWIE